MKAAATIGSTSFAVATAENKAKVEMYRVMQIRDAQDAAEAAILQQEHMRAHECNVERSRKGQTHRNQGISDAHRQRTYLELAKLPQSSNQPLSPTAASSGLIQMAIAPEVPARMVVGATNEP